MRGCEVVHTSGDRADSVYRVNTQASYVILLLLCTEAIGSFDTCNRLHGATFQKKLFVVATVKLSGAISGNPENIVYHLRALSPFCDNLFVFQILGWF
jgi:hypothetical protein